MIIGFAGKAGSGKNWYGQKLNCVLSGLGYCVGECSIAEDLKKITNGCLNDNLSLVIDIIQDFCFGTEQYFSAIKINKLAKKYINYSKKHYKDEDKRRFLQLLADDIKHDFGQSVFIQSLFSWFGKSISNKRNMLIITDVRFPCDVDEIVKRGGIVFYLDVSEGIRSERLDTRGDNRQVVGDAKNHSSETALSEFTYDVICPHAEQVKGSAIDETLKVVLDVVFDRLINEEAS